MPILGMYGSVREDYTQLDSIACLLESVTSQETANSLKRLMHFNKIIFYFILTLSVMNLCSISVFFFRGTDLTGRGGMLNRG